MATSLARNVAHRLSAVGHAQGLDMARVLARVGIDQDAGWPRGDVSVTEVSRLTQELWLLTGDELFGLGNPAPLGSFAVMMRSAISAKDLREFIQRISEAAKVLSGLPPIRPVETEADMRIHLDPAELHDPLHLAAEMLTVLIHRVLAWASGQRIALASVQLPWPEPAYANGYEVVLGVHPHFGGSDIVLAFERRHLSAPIIRDEAALMDYLEDQPGAWYSTRDYETSVASRVRTLLQQGRHGTWPTSEAIAEQLGLSLQHLRRLLHKEGTSIRQIKEETLRDAAVASLGRGDESVEELASRLGFSEGSAFRRAFRRWTGHSPSDFRRDARIEGSAGQP